MSRPLYTKSGVLISPWLDEGRVQHALVHEHGSQVAGARGAMGAEGVGILFGHPAAKLALGVYSTASQDALVATLNLRSVLLRCSCFSRPPLRHGLPRKKALPNLAQAVPQPRKLLVGNPNKPGCLP